MSSKNSITYRRVGDFNIPNLTLPTKETTIRLCKWGMLHKDYLQKNKKVLFTTLLTQGKLFQHCAEVEKQTRELFDTLIEQMKITEGVTEQLKEENQLEWAQMISNIQQSASEIVCKELIYV